LYLENPDSVLLHNINPFLVALLVGRSDHHNDSFTGGGVGQERLLPPLPVGCLFACDLPYGGL
jgi:hypothetical protein